jgi:FkbM family methyltransferase
MFTSYAQNFEDVMLWRALKHVENGVYVDVGAQHPVIDSVSLAFYEHGWRGVHVEPAPDYANLLREHRPDEVVVQAALDAKRGLLAFFDIKQSGLSTADEDIARRHRHAGFEVHEISVPSLTLDDVFSGLAGKEIHWLKIDVEGYERQVLEGWASAAKPWVIVIESTLPLTQTESYQDWEQLILDRGYEIAYSDGINRFYVASGHLDLLAAFRYGPNYFDGFKLSTNSPYCDDLNATIAALRERGQTLDAELATREHQATQALKAVGELEGELAHSRAQNDGLFGNLQTLQGELAQRQRELAQQQGELTQLRSQSDVLLDRLVAAERRAAGLEAEASRSLQRQLALEAGLAEARTQLAHQGEELAGSRSRADWLAIELNAAASQAEQSIRSTHHWWTVAVGLSHELEMMRGSRSWRMTVPLRAASSLFVRTKRLGLTGLAKLISLPRRGARRMLLLAVSAVQARPGLKAQVARWVAGFPRLEAHLQAFVSTRWHKGRAADGSAAVGQSAPVPTAEPPVEASTDGIQWASQSPSVRKAYQQLTQARAGAQVDSDPDSASDKAR